MALPLVRAAEGEDKEQTNAAQTSDAGVAEVADFEAAGAPGTAEAVDEVGGHRSAGRAASLVVGCGRLQQSRARPCRAWRVFGSQTRRFLLRVSWINRTHIVR